MSCWQLLCLQKWCTACKKSVTLLLCACYKSLKWMQGWFVLIRQNVPELLILKYKTFHRQCVPLAPTRYKRCIIIFVRFDHHFYFILLLLFVFLNPSEVFLIKRRAPLVSQGMFAVRLTNETLKTWCNIIPPYQIKPVVLCIQILC